jgi:ppGpp synthetase/RelA/SpoT-type nucleotidyltranferase
MQPSSHLNHEPSVSPSRVSSKRISIFNHKGGVGKTTLTYNISATLAEIGKNVLIVDSYPQCNLTAYVIDNEVLDDLLDRSDTPSGGTAWSAVKPIVDGTGSVKHVSPIELDSRLWLLPGDIRLSDFESDLNDLWRLCFQRKKRGFAGTSALSMAVNEICKNKKIDFVFYDTGPNIGALNKRIKDPEHLRDKLLRKFGKCKEDGKLFDITTENMFEKITDLGGIRILHLHTKQVQEIDRELRTITEEMRITLSEGPFARTWDDESRNFFSQLGFSTQESPTMYTSVHYVVASNSRTVVTCEIQVRTLMEEVCGEVNHAINYPQEIDSVACTEQIRALARSTSSATRLVDAIFATVADIERQSTVKRQGARRSSSARKPTKHKRVRR